MNRIITFSKVPIVLAFWNRHCVTTSQMIKYKKLNYVNGSLLPGISSPSTPAPTARPTTCWAACAAGQVTWPRSRGWRRSGRAARGRVSWAAGRPSPPAAQPTWSSSGPGATSPLQPRYLHLGLFCMFGIKPEFGFIENLAAYRQMPIV
jgi:hypothetical protein